MRYNFPAGVNMANYITVQSFIKSKKKYGIEIFT